MNYGEVLNHLLISNKLSIQRAPSLEEWTNFIAEADNQIKFRDEQLTKCTSLQQLSFEEMKAWSSLVEVRESTIKGIIDSSTNMILTVNKTGHISEFNHVSEEKTGYTKKEIIGKSIFEVLPPSPFLQSLKEILSTNLKTDNKPYKFETQVIARNLISFTADANISIIKIGHDFIYAIYIHDLTSELEAKANMELIREQAIHGSKMASLGEMAAGVAHEINNPLAIIILACKIMKTSLKDAAKNKEMLHETLDTISATTERIANIIKGLKTFSRQSELKDMIEVGINDIVGDALNLCRERFKNHGIELTFENERNSLLLCQPIAISQVLLNLLNNSFDAIDGLSEKFVTIRWEEKKDVWQLSVTDSGTGIKKALADKIMQPFFTTKEIGKGTGLGLSISKGIMDHHGGSLTYDSSSPNTTFVMSFNPSKQIERTAT